MTKKIDCELQSMLGNYPVDEHSIDGGVQAVTVYLANALAETDVIDLHVIAFDQSIKNRVQSARFWNNPWKGINCLFSLIKFTML